MKCHSLCLITLCEADGGPRWPGNARNKMKKGFSLRKCHMWPFWKGWHLKQCQPPPLWPHGKKVRGSNPLAPFWVGFACSLKVLWLPPTALWSTCDLSRAPPHLSVNVSWDRRPSKDKRKTGGYCNDLSFRRFSTNLLFMTWGPAVVSTNNQLFLAELFVTPESIIRFSKVFHQTLIWWQDDSCQNCPISFLSVHMTSCL